MDTALIVLTAGLTLATIALAYFTWTLASEAKQQRLLNVRPHFTLGVEMLDPIIGVITVNNVGAGSGLDTALTITFESDQGTDTREWFAATILPRATHQFRLPRPRPGAREEAMSEAAIERTRVRLRGKS